jgi:hypothetical protein
VPTQTTPPRVQHVGFRRVLAWVLAFALCALLAGCGSSDPPAPLTGAAEEHAEERAIAVQQKKDEAEDPHASQEATEGREREQAADKRQERAAQRAARRKHEQEAREHREEEARARAPHTVPNEANQRLDVAEEELEGQGWHFKTVGGGLFGVVVKSDWTVCETRPSGGETVAASTTIRLIVARACP